MFGRSTVLYPTTSIHNDSTWYNTFIRRQHITWKSDLRSIRLSHKRIWMRVRDPKRKLTETSTRTLDMFKHWLHHFSPVVSLRPRHFWSGQAATTYLSVGFSNSSIDSSQCFAITMDQRRWTWYGSHPYSLANACKVRMFSQRACCAISNFNRSRSQMCFFWIYTYIFKYTKCF